MLVELAERIDPKRLFAIAKKGEELPVVQRLGYLLERTGHAEIAAGLSKLVDRDKPKFIRLEPQSSEEVSERNERWRVLVNTTIEVET